MTSLSLTASVGKFNPLDPIGSILDNAFDDVEKTMHKVANDVGNVTKDVIMKAAEQAARLIESLKAAYEDSLKLTYKAADKLLQENIDRVNDLVKDIVERNEKALLKLIERTGEIIKFSPLSNWWLPLLSDVTPRYFAVDSLNDKPTATTVLVTFTGNFAYAEQYAPTFKLNGRAYKPVDNNTTQLKFAIEVSSDDSQLRLHNVAFLTGTLSVDWKNGSLPWSWTVSHYKTLLGVLPTTPGKIKVIFEKAEKIITKTFSADPVRVTATPKHWTDTTLNYKPHADWHVVRGSSSLHWLEQFGQKAHQLLSDDHDLVSYQVSRKDGGGLVQVVFTEGQTIAASTRALPKEDLRWGNSWVVAPENGEKITKIVFEAFNGSLFEFQPRTDNSNPFIDLRLFDGTIQISAKRAGEINVDSLALTTSKVVTMNPPKEGKKEYKDESTDKKESKKDAP